MSLTTARRFLFGREILSHHQPTQEPGIPPALGRLKQDERRLMAAKTKEIDQAITILDKTIQDLMLKVAKLKACRPPLPPVRPDPVLPHPRHGPWKKGILPELPRVTAMDETIHMLEETIQSFHLKLFEFKARRQPYRGRFEPTINPLTGAVINGRSKRKNGRRLADLACEMLFNIELMASDAQPGKKGIEGVKFQRL